MSAPILNLHGTWGRDDIWFRRGSAFTTGLHAAGLSLVHDEPFLWSGNVGGLPFSSTPDDPRDLYDDSGRLEWANEARHGIYYCAAYRPGQEVSVLAHSHGGQVALLMIALGLKVRHLITISAPVRKDMLAMRWLARERISGTWVALHGDFWKDRMIKLGELFDGSFGWSMTFPEAHKNIHVKGHGHSTMLTDVTVLDTLGILTLLST